MAMGKRKSVEQPLFLTCNDLPHSEGHPFYVVVNRVLAESEFDRYVESACQKFYAQTMGRPSVAPGMYFMMGDNRDNSVDSRYYGPVPRANLRGTPMFVYYSYNADDSDRPLPFITDIRWGRIGHWIR